MKVEQVSDALTEAVNDALTMIGKTVEIDDASFDNQEANVVLSTIFLKGQIIGKVMLGLSLECAAKIVSEMLGQSVAGDSHECFDGMGEILNIIIGGTKTKCASEGFDFDISIPTTKITKLPNIEKSANREVIISNFKGDTLSFQMILSYQMRVEPKAKKAEDIEKPKLSAAELLMKAMQDDSDS